MKIEHTTPPNSEDVDFLTQQLNQETPDKGSAYPFAFFIRNDSQEIIGGCNGSVVFGVIYTDQLWVHQDYRKQGLELELMTRVHNYGREVGCTMATVNTMNFQNAKQFYERLGYICDFERFGYSHDASCIFLKKAL